MAGIYSPREMARLMGVQEQSVKQWYQGKTRPNERNIANLISLLNVRYEWLVHGKRLKGRSLVIAEPGDPASDFSDAIAVLSGMGGLLLGRSSGVNEEGAEKIGRAIIQASKNADQAFQVLLKCYLKHCND